MMNHPARGSIREVGALLGLELPEPGKRSYCPFRKHKRREKSFSVFLSGTGDELWKCHSCDPPDNVGDAVALYARLRSLSHSEAIRELRERGVLGTKAGQVRVLRAKAETARVAPRQRDVLQLDLATWELYKRSYAGAVRDFAERRGLDANLLIQHDVVQVRDRAIGFGYRDPETGQPCRIKCRAVEDKTFWIEPASRDGKKALAPLYLAHALTSGGTVIVCEGEVDALTLMQAGYQRVVSLPDGASSAKDVSLAPIERYGIWYVATDADRAGDEAARVLRSRAVRFGIRTVRVRWEDEHGTVHKDANDAWRAGWRREQFARCLSMAAKRELGFGLSCAADDESRVRTELEKARKMVEVNWAKRVAGKSREDVLVTYTAHDAERKLPYDRDATKRANRFPFPGRQVRQEIQAVLDEPDRYRALDPRLKLEAHVQDAYLATWSGRSVPAEPAAVAEDLLASYDPQHRCRLVDVPLRHHGVGRTFAHLVCLYPDADQCVLLDLAIRGTMVLLDAATQREVPEARKLAESPPRRRKSRSEQDDDEVEEAQFSE